MPAPLILAIDQGTTSSRCLLIDETGTVVAIDQREHRQIMPRPGWIEHDAQEIWANVAACIAGVLARGGVRPADIAAVGITNQRETCLVWDRRSGRPIHNAIVWQDTRTEPLLSRMAGDGGRDRFRASTGLPLASYFSAAKIAWLLDNVDGARAAAEAGHLAAGTMDSWLIWKLTGRHVSDVTNASRTQLMNLATLDWDDALLDAFAVPRAVLPQIVPSSALYGEAREMLAGVPVAGALGDQQAALIGQGCFNPGDSKCTYGTGNFLLANTGAVAVGSKAGLVTTIAYRFGDAPPAYALEGSIAVTGSLVQWLRDQVGMIASASEIEALAASVDDSGGAVVVPAFSGLFAPHWRPDARGAILGLTRYVGKAHLARAALEAVAWQTREVVDAVVADLGQPIPVLSVDGGMTANDLLMQIQADVLGAEVARAANPESTALGAAFAAGLAIGLWPNTDALAALVPRDARWTPQRDDAWRAAGLARWRKGVACSLDWA
jgi:glycerol kinase